MSMYDLDDFQRDLERLASKFKDSKEARKFMQQQGNKLNRKVKKSYKQNTQKQDEKLAKSFKRGKVYKYQGKDLSVRAYNGHPLAHLVNDGFMHKGGRGNKKAKEPKEGRETWVEGTFFLESASNAFKEEYYKNMSDWVDDMLNKGF